jgi:adenylate kinase family enzyme
MGLLAARLSQPDCQSRGWLLDGFPHTAAQARRWRLVVEECARLCTVDMTLITMEHDTHHHGTAMKMRLCMVTWPTLSEAQCQ